MNAGWAKQFVAIALLAASLPVFAAGQDIVVVFDNSGSMRTNDPHFLARAAVERLIESAGPDDRVALVVFADDVRVALPLTRVDAGTGPRIATALDAIDYRGPWTDIPGAVERGLYVLRADARDGVTRDVLLLTDGIVDTGDAARDRAREAWLLDELGPAAQAESIRIFGIAFSDDADYRLIQALAARTNGDYARALAPAALAGAFDRLQRAMAPPPPPVEEPVVDEAPIAEPAPAQPVAAPRPELPLPEAGEPAPGFPAWLVALLLVLVGAGAGGFVWYRKRPAHGLDAGAPGAVVTDMSGVTGHDSHRIDGAVAVFGRKPGDDFGLVTNIVIPQHTVSRRHATIRWRDGRYWLIDHDSANGTWLNEERVIGEEPLSDGSHIRIDTYEFAFSMGVPDATQVRGADEPEAGDHTVVRGQASSTTQFKTEMFDGSSPWDEIDDEVIDTVLTEYEQGRKKD